MIEQKHTIIEIPVSDLLKKQRSITRRDTGWCRSAVQISATGMK